MITGLMAAWPIIRRFWFVGPLVILAFVVLFQRVTIAGKAQELAGRKAQVVQLTQANEAAAKTIDRLAQARIDNDAIANAVAEKVGANTTRETIYRTTIEKVKADDPQVRAWAAVPVPSSVRAALSGQPAK